MAEDLKIGGAYYSEVEYVTIRNGYGEDVKYYKEGSEGGGSGGGSGLNYRTDTEQESQEILKQVVI